jgi:integrase
MGVFARGSVLWIRYRDINGKWRNESTGCPVGHERQAEEALEKIEAHIAACRTPSVIAKGSMMTLRVWAKKWLDARDTETMKDDKGRLDNHILPVLGDLPLSELRPRHIRDFIDALKKKKKLGNLKKNGKRVECDELIAPRTVLHVYGTLRAMLNDAVADELIPTNPCILKDELPEKKDKDRTWRRTAVFARDEVQAIISAPSNKVPNDRRVMYAIMFLGAMRFGEAAAITWRDYDTKATPLGKLIIEKSYSSKTRQVKATKTDNPREMPVHPTLAKVLAEWKLEGFERFVGRKPKPEDLIVPALPNLEDKKTGSVHSRNANHMLRRFHEDLERIGLRARRQHDARRTFISIARADGARADILRWATHGSTGSIVDDYTTLPWAALCEEVAKLQISLIEGKLIELPMAAAGTAFSGPTGVVTQLVTASQPAVTRTQSWRSGRDLNAQAPVGGDAPAQPILGLASRRPVMDECSRSETRNDSLQTGPVLSNLISISNKSLVTPLVTVAEAAVTSGVKSRSGRDSNPRPPA